MPIYNKCSICHQRVTTQTPPDPLFAQLLRDTTDAHCHHCNPLSAWHRTNNKGEPRHERGT